MNCRKCGSECRVRAAPDEVKGGDTFTVQYYYCVKHGDQFKKLSGSHNIITGLGFGKPNIVHGYINDSVDITPVK